MLVRAEIGLPPGPNGGEATIQWIAYLASRFQMTALTAPSFFYCETPGTRGMRGFAMTDVGEISLIVLDETAPAIAMIDVKSSAELSVDDIVTCAAAFNWSKIDYKYLDRTTGLDVMTEGSMGGPDATPTGELPPAAPDANTTTNADSAAA